MTTGTLAGKVALVTGGGSGIGRASCLALANAGAAVMAADIDLSGAEETASQIIAAGGQGAATQVDVSKPSECEAMVDATLDELGGLHVVHANAGIAGLD